MAIPIAHGLLLVLILVGGLLVFDGELLFEGADLVLHRQFGEDGVPATLLRLLRIRRLVDKRGQFFERRKTILFLVLSD